MKQGFIKNIFITLAAFTLLIPFNLHAAESINQIPKDLYPAVNHLLACVESGGKETVNPDMIPRILDYVEIPKTLGETMSLGEHDGAASDYYEFSVNRSLKEVLDLTYNPDLPPNLTQPSSVRRSQWMESNDQKVTLPRLSDKLGHLDTPLIISGLEFIENSPDTFSGAYYSYNVDRILILIKHRGRPALVSVSNQRGLSEVGKKGIILGKDEEWNYVYSGEKGTTMKGASWADTYMYGSASITIYYELNENPGQVKCAVFKWINAGWLGVNFVKPSHIRKGLERFAKDFREIVESPSLADTESLAMIFRKIQALPFAELKAVAAEYYNQKNVNRFQVENSQYKKWIDKLFKEDKYINGLNRKEMEALVSIEYLKYKMGKYNSGEQGYFPALSIEGKLLPDRR